MGGRGCVVPAHFAEAMRMRIRPLGNRANYNGKSDVAKIELGDKEQSAFLAAQRGSYRARREKAISDGRHPLGAGAKQEKTASSRNTTDLSSRGIAKTSQ